jgi:heme a synthase
VLANPARIAIHVTHRIGAVLAGSILCFTGAMCLARSRARAIKLAGGLLVFAVLLQICVGTAMVHFGMPLPVATLHNACAAFLVICIATLLRMLWPEPAIGMIPLHHVHRSR